MSSAILVLFALTLLVELPIVYLLAPRERRPGVLLDALLLNGFTWPLATLAVHQGLPWWPVEAGVVLVEAFGYWRLGRIGARRAMVLATAANAATMLVALSLPGGPPWT